MRAPHQTQLAWESESKDEQFTLAFFALLGGGRAWPFNEPEQGKFPTNRFTGTLKGVTGRGPGPSYKYTVSISGSKLLDPIIIVDK